MRQVAGELLKPLVDCPDGCGAYGILNPKTGRVKKCANARRQQGLANKRSGQKAQTRARKLLDIPGAHRRSQLGNEENWRHPWFRFEVKSGQQVEPIATRFLAAEKQANAPVNRSIGDLRPFVMVAMPSGFGGDGLVVMRLRDWREQIGPALEEATASSTVRFEPAVRPRPFDQDAS